LESLFNKIKANLVDQIFNSSSNDVFNYFYGNLVNKLSSKSRFFQFHSTLSILL